MSGDGTLSSGGALTVSTISGVPAVTTTGSQTLTNKTLTSPVISGGTISGVPISLYDNGPAFKNLTDPTKTLQPNLANIPPNTALSNNPPLVISGGYYTGLSYAVTASQAPITGATTVAITEPGTYLFFSSARLDAVGALAATYVTTLNLYRSNNNAGNIAGAQQAFLPAIVTAAQTEGVISLPVVSYTTSNPSISLTAGGTGYTTATNVPTSGGHGSGLTVNITASGGVIQTAVIDNPGNGLYQSGDAITVVQSGGSSGTVTGDIADLITMAAGAATAMSNLEVISVSILPVRIY